jgi:DNA-binding CsgD family transcriptional regulator
MPLSKFAAEVSGPISKDDLFRSLGRYLRGYGAEFYGYHVQATHLRQLNWDEGFVYNNVSPEFTRVYRERGYDAIDPIRPLAAKRAEPFFWSEVPQLVNLTPAQRDYLAFLKQFGVREGISVPVFGAKGTVAVVAAGTMTQDLRIGPDDLLDLQLVCAFVHRRFLQLFGASDQELPTLTKREREVLGWIAQGKSTSVIASILGVSEHTIDTLTRRTFQKLGVNDRISAVLKAVGAGLVSV